MKKLDCNSHLNDACVHSPRSPVPLSSSREMEWEEKERKGKEGRKHESRESAKKERKRKNFSAFFLGNSFRIWKEVLLFISEIEFQIWIIKWIQTFVSFFLNQKKYGEIAFY